MKRLLPGKTVERLSICRRILLDKLQENKKFIYSHEIARLLHITSVQVRRDFMLMGYSGSPSKGYEIKKLIKFIGKKIDSKEGNNVGIIGMGNLGKALVKYLIDKRENLRVVASFDKDDKKIKQNDSDVPCFHIDSFPDVAKELDISIGIITVPTESAVDVADMIVECGIKGILNYTTKPLKVPPEVYLEEYDIITSLEKVAYFIKH